jgi:hypothetical protein
LFLPSQFEGIREMFTKNLRILETNNLAMDLFRKNITASLIYKRLVEAGFSKKNINLIMSADICED